MILDRTLVTLVGEGPDSVAQPLVTIKAFRGGTENGAKLVAVSAEEIDVSPQPVDHFRSQVVDFSLRRPF